jgi:hypothetical protein
MIFSAVIWSSARFVSTVCGLAITVTGWLAAAEVITATLNEFHRQVTARVDERAD